MCLTPEMITGLFTIAGACLGACIGYFGASRIATKQARSIAAAKLRAAFAPELADLELAARKHKDVNVMQLLHSAFPKHAAAIEEYRPFVRLNDAVPFQKAWEDYYCKGGSVRFYPDTVETVVDESVGPTTQVPYIERIQDILRFAKT